MKTQKTIPFHLILLSVYPILALMAFNLGEFPLSDGLRSLLFSFIGTIFLWLLLWIMLRDWGKSALISSLFLVFFYSYGHIYLLIKHIQIGDFLVGRHRYLLPIYGLVFFIGVYWILKIAKNIPQTSLALNWITKSHLLE
jgi:hypothetical protein